MKKLLLILFFIPFVGMSQSLSDLFIIKDNNLIWQKVYESETGIQEVFSNIKSSGYVSSVEIANNEIYGDIKDLKLLYKEAGLKWGNTAVYVSGMNAYASFRIELKEGRYRVTVSSIKMASQKSIGAFQNNNSFTSLSDLATRNGLIKDSFIKKEGLAYGYTFNEIFKPKSKTDDNW